mmetsp:Transcript_649/g.2208  ORF Transcript_649/g.2208 Transcript_649/m.2208 type:complete len:224 (-) Transcript_649:491-1162(-)
MADACFATATPWFSFERTDAEDAAFCVAFAFGLFACEDSALLVSAFECSKGWTVFVTSATSSLNSFAHTSSLNSVPAARTARNANRHPTASNATPHPTTCETKPLPWFLNPKSVSAPRRAAPTHATANIHSQVSRTPSFVTAAISFSIVIRSTSSAQMASPLRAMFSSVVTFRTVPSGPKPRAPAFATNANKSESTKTLPESSANVAQGADPSSATAHAHIAT